MPIVQVKLDHAIKFLCDDMKVRVKLRFKGRQKAHKEFGFQVVNRFVKEAAAYGLADSPPKLLGDRDLNVVISPLPRNKRARTSPGGRSLPSRCRARCRMIQTSNSTNLTPYILLPCLGGCGILYAAW